MESNPQHRRASDVFLTDVPVGPCGGPVVDVVVRLIEGQHVVLALPVGLIRVPEVSHHRAAVCPQEVAVVAQRVVAPLLSGQGGADVVADVRRSAVACFGEKSGKNVLSS